MARLVKSGHRSWPKGAFVWLLDNIHVSLAARSLIGGLALSTWSVSASLQPPSSFSVRVFSLIPAASLHRDDCTDGEYPPVFLEKALLLLLGHLLPVRANHGWFAVDQRRLRRRARPVQHDVHIAGGLEGEAVRAKFDFLGLLGGCGGFGGAGAGGGAGGFLFETLVLF